MSAEQLDLDPIRARRQVVDATVDMTMVLASQATLRPKLMQEMAMAAARSCADVPDLLLEVERLRAVVERVEAVAQEWEDDDDAHLVKHGQHLPGSVARMAELLRAAITGATS